MFLGILIDEVLGHDRGSYQAMDTIYVGFEERIKAKDNRQDQAINKRLKHSEKNHHKTPENPQREFLRDKKRTLDNFS